MLNVVTLSVIMLSIIMLNVVTLIVIMLNVITLSVVGPNIYHLVNDLQTNFITLSPQFEQDLHNRSNCVHENFVIIY